MEGFENMSDEEKLKAENDFLKMKMMLERGAEFEKTEEGNELSADIENQFLRNIMEFEKQFDQHKIITIFDKIGRPTQFKPVNEIPDNTMEDAWDELYNYMLNHGIDLSATNPKVTARELYRFATEELFDHQTDDINIPGMISGFIYDEFYPDYEYENTNAALECIKLIFEKELAEHIPNLAKKITLNNHKELSAEACADIINQFKDAFNDIVLHNAEVASCTIEETTCTIKGAYSATGLIGSDKIDWNDSWTVIFHFDDDLGYWEIVTVLIQNINF
ncbi:hypothetical protein FRZ67_06035 [Panacibacter ginsenosidivorans]|uniref:Uncharacterized protein n=1 Tax=Panacibacter ginsenosidivorans TaxID=1813871 RepID=A0A5B8V6H9_9BACT|nr:hypothetical protein [Panacibacter ginsenosidivorans]QEC66882.1 hypothetical protein FRZ67_06035 [Panacibacter ginsenosidivorans]